MSRGLFDQRHGTHPLLAKLDSFWRSEEAVLLAAHRNHIAAIDALNARIEAVLSPCKQGVS
jgi:hypothetical protein